MIEIHNMEVTLNAIRSRPRFKLFTQLTPERFTEELKKNKEKESSFFTGKISLQESFIEVKTDDYPIWKPRLTLRAEVDTDVNITVIRGIFGPRPTVWTLFMFFYIIFGTSFLIFLSLYYSMYLVKSINDIDFYWAGIATFFCLAVVLITYILARIGRVKSKKEINQLREFAERAILQYENND